MMTRTEKFKHIHLQCEKENAEAYMKYPFINEYYLYHQNEIKKEIGAAKFHNPKFAIPKREKCSLNNI